MTNPLAVFEPICKECGICNTSLAYKVWGEGNPSAEIVLLGEALGEEEEREGRPFVGRAGWLLNRSLREADLLRSQVYISNSIKCRPTNAIGKNRPPTTAELEYCRTFLDEELAALPNVKVIIALGASATWSLLSPNSPMGGVLENQGKTFWSERYQKWVITTIHPAWALRKPGDAFWLTQDLMKAKRIAESGQPPAIRQPEYRVVRTLADAEEMRATLLAAPYLVWDWETDGLHPLNARGFCVSLCGTAHFAWVVPRYGAWFIPLWARQDLTRLDDILREVFLSDVPKIGHNVQFDYIQTITTLGVRPRNVVGCTMLASHTIYNHFSERAHGLKRMSDVYTPYGRYDDELDRWLVENKYTREGKPDHGYIYRAPSEIVWKYNAIDSIVPWLVHPILETRLRERDLWDFYSTERIPFALRYAEMDRAGVRISEPGLAALSADLQSAITIVTAKLQEVTGKPDFNPNSHPQVAKYLFEERGYPILARTETGAPSTKEEVLKEFEQVEPSAALILHARTYRKLKSTFVDGKNEESVGGIKAAVDRDGYARPNTLHHVVETFRLATRKPFPTHVLPRPLVLYDCPVGHGSTLLDKCCDLAIRRSLNIRGVVIPKDGHVLLAADYVQEEYALIAIASGQTDLEEAMLDRGEDAHEFVMHLLSGRSVRDYQVEVAPGKWVFRDKEAEDEAKNVRSYFKSVNFLIAYRGGAKHLAASLSTKEKPVVEADAIQIIADYYDRLPMIKWWQYRTIKSLRATGRVVGLFKTYRELPNIYSPYKYDQFEAERQGCNQPFQDGGAHLLIRAVNGLDELWERKKLPARLIFSVHDELLAEARDDVAEEAAADMRLIMERPQPELVGGCGIPRGIKVDIKAMREWNGKTIDLHGLHPREIIRTPIPVAV